MRDEVRVLLRVVAAYLFGGRIWRVILVRVASLVERAREAPGA